ncbi:family 43 glycosylhydrolase [Paenibacillus riograndensis]|nr:family 43 glycosylhydrolase [Paenibacillus riograndensis]
MTAGFLTSDNLVDWDFHPLKDVPIYDYAPDVRVIGEYIYFSASSKSKNCSFFRTKDPIQEEFEEIPGDFPFWDPNLFVDDDGRIYFYWGCSNLTPIYGVELNPEDMKPIGMPVELIFGKPAVHGYERNGEHHVFGRTPEQIEEMVQAYAESGSVPEEKLKLLRIALGSDPYIEGAWMDKYNGKYYLQYASPATEVNVYSDGVYVSDKPLGPFALARNNPYSYKPGGFIPGAGHGSTLEDKLGNRWHAASMRVSVNHPFERRMGLWPAGFDQDGELFCNQRYGDWPMKIEQAAMNPWSNPEWMLLSYGKPARASSYEAGKEASKATDESIQSWWKAVSNQPGEWLEVDLNHVCDVHAVQINFADDQLNLTIPEGVTPMENGELRKTKRYIDGRKHVTRWLLEGSVDGTDYFVIEDKSGADSDLPHDLVVKEAGVTARFVRCTVKELPYHQNACISGLRVFGIGEGKQPDKITGVQTKLLSELDLSVSWASVNAVGYNVLWGFAPDKLYHSYMVLGKSQVDIGALIKGQSLYVRVDAFNEKGITEGDVYRVIE